MTSLNGNLDTGAAAEGGRGWQIAHILALLALCAAYIQGSLTKIFDFQGAQAEMVHFGLLPAPFFAMAVVVFELAMSALILIGRYRAPAAVALSLFTLAATFIALRFWELPPGMERNMATNAFFEHVGLAGAFVLVALHELSRRARHWRE